MFESGDDPVRCIVPLDGGGVVLGTGGRGRVIRVDDAGRPFVLFDAEEAEIVALDVTQDGTVLALAARAAKQSAAARSAAVTAHETVRVTASAPEPNDDGERQVPEDRERTAGRRRPSVQFNTPPGGALYRIAPDGDSRQLWQSTRDAPFGLVRRDADTWLVATGDAGRIYAIDAEGRLSVAAQIPSDQASTMSRGPRGSILVGGTTDARVARLGPELRSRGEYVSAVHDAGTVADWGRLRWEAERPAGSVVRAAARVGNTAEPDETWTEWVRLEGDSAQGVATALPPTRWFQTRLELAPGHGGAAPHVRHVELFYRPRNRRPAITGLTVHPAGVVWTRGPLQVTRPTGPLVTTDPVSRRTASELAATVVPKSIRKSYELGGRTVSWQAADPDGDTLAYRVDLRREGKTSWIPLAADVESDFLGWDVRSMPDGLYRVRLIADDARDNPDGKQHQVSRVSGPFRIDNTRPSVGAPRIRKDGASYRVEFVANDPGGNVVAAEVAVDAGAWEPLDPLDGVADSSEERYELVVAPPERDPGYGPHTVKVRVTDAAGNMGGDAWTLDD